MIFTLAGHKNRQIYGLKLLRDGWAKTILISTGDPKFTAEQVEEALRGSEVGAEELHRVREYASAGSAGSRYFFVCFGGSEWSVEPISTGFFGTLSEVKALSCWLQRHRQVGSVLIISRDNHLRRIRMCCRKLLPKRVSFQMISVPPKYPGRVSHKQILVELTKLLVYTIVLGIRGNVQPPTGGCGPD